MAPTGKTRTPSEERQYKERRNQQKRECARRRRADSAVREKERVASLRRYHESRERPGVIEKQNQLRRERYRRYRADSAKLERERAEALRRYYENRKRPGVIEKQNRQRRERNQRRRANSAVQEKGTELKQKHAGSDAGDAAKRVFPGTTVPVQYVYTTNAFKRDFDGKTSETTEAEPEGSTAASDEEIFKMPVTIEVGIGDKLQLGSLCVAVADEPLDIAAAAAENVWEDDEILGITGIETLVLAAECRARKEVEQPRACSMETRSTCLL